MIHNLTETELYRYAEEFYISTDRAVDPADIDISEDLDIHLIVMCIVNPQFRINAGGSHNPAVENLIVEFETWLKPLVRKSKISSLPFLKPNKNYSQLNSTPKK